LVEWTKTDSRSLISTLKRNHNITRSSAELQPPQTVPIINKFSVLTNLSDPTSRHDATASESNEQWLVSPKTTKGTKSEKTQYEE